jgi:small subunit ribosomal protein S1
MASSISAGSFGGFKGGESDSSFASEFEALLRERVDNKRTGTIVPGVVTHVGKEVVSVDIGFKSEGVVPTEQFPHVDGKIQVKVGDPVDVFIIALENEMGQVLLSKEKADQKRVWEQIENTFKTDGRIKGRVVQKVKGGLHVDVGIPAFLPGSQIDIRPHRNLDKFIGQEYEFKVLKITRDKGNIVLSRRSVLLGERDELRAATLKVLQEGVVMEGVVKNVTDYGAFIDLGGIDGLLHITDISWGRINHPSEKLSVGQTVPVVVLKYDQEKERVSLGMKQLTPDPWITAHERFPIGGRVKGRVKSVTDYGAFVELEEGVEGLIHVSEMSWTKKVRHPSKIVTEGEQVEAVILGIDSEQQRISLGLKQLLPNPWEDLQRIHPIGSRVQGKVRSITEFGIFVGIEEGIDGLVHISDFSWTKRIKDPKEIQELFKKGDDVEAVVLDIDVSNERLSLGIKQLSQDPWDTIAQRHPVGTKINGTVTAITEFGVFVEVENGVEGLIHNSQLGVEKGVEVAQAFPVGSQVEAEVTNVDTQERRISLSARSIKERARKDSSYDAQYMGDEEGTRVTFGDLIREQLRNDKE